MKQELRALTGLRGISALAVTLYHFSFQGRLGPNLVRRVLGHGYMAVDLFFILSGFVLAFNYADCFRDQYDWRVYATYLGRRLARIYPLYIFMTIICAAIAYVGLNTMWLGPRQELEKLVINASMLQCLGGGYSIDVPAWSVSTEFVASLVFPLLCATALFRSRSAACALGATCALVLALLSLVPDSWTPGTQRAAHMSWLEHHDALTLFAVYRCLADFTLGFLTWRVFASPVGAWLNTRTWPGMALLCLLAILLCFRDVDTVTVLLFPILVLSLTTDRTAPARFLGGRAFHALGIVSYSLYLVHLPVYDVGERWAALFPGSRLPVTLLDLGMSAGVATITYAAIEKPGRRLGRRLVASALTGHLDRQDAINKHVC